MSVDIGAYNQDPEQYKKLVEELYEQYPAITLPPEYAYFVEDNLLRFLIRLARYKFVARMLKPTDRVLEVGSGSGLGSMFLAQHCAHVTGVELKTTELKEAEALKRRDNVTFIQKDLFDFDTREKFDVVVALDVIEHMPVEKGRELLGAMAALTAPDGMLIIGTPSIHSYPYQGALSQASHVKCYDLPELREVIEERYARTLPFSMNDEVVHTGHPKMAWYYFVIGVSPRG